MRFRLVTPPIVTASGHGRNRRCNDRWLLVVWLWENGRRLENLAPAMVYISCHRELMAGATQSRATNTNSRSPSSGHGRDRRYNHRWWRGVLKGRSATNVVNARERGVINFVCVTSYRERMANLTQSRAQRRKPPSNLRPRTARRSPISS